MVNVETAYTTGPEMVGLARYQVTNHVELGEVSATLATLQPPSVALAETLSQLRTAPVVKQNSFMMTAHRHDRPIGVGFAIFGRRPGFSNHLEGLDVATADHASQTEKIELTREIIGRICDELYLHRFTITATSHQAVVLAELKQTGVIRTFELVKSPAGDQEFLVTIRDVLDDFAQPPVSDQVQLRRITPAVARRLRTLFEDQQLSQTEQMHFILRYGTKGRGHCRIVPSGERQYHINSDHFSSLSDSDQQQLQLALGYLQAMISRPEIVDGFGDNHGEPGSKGGRTGWKQDMVKQFGTIFSDTYNENRLRWGTVNQILSACQIIDMILFEHPELSELGQTAQDLFNFIIENFPSKEDFQIISGDRRRELLAELIHLAAGVLAKFEAYGTEPTNPQVA